MRKKRLVRVIVFFFSALAVLTFCSRTIYRHMLPNVQVVGITGGMLTYEHTSYDICICSDQSASVQLSVLFSRPLTISDVFVKPNQYVAPGDALLTFHAPDGEYLIQEAQNRLDLATSTLMLWENEYENRMTDMAATIKKTKKKAEKERLEKEYALLESGIMNATTKTQLDSEVELWKQTLAALKQLKSDQWRLKAVSGGFIEQVYAKPNDVYSGLSPLITICPENANILIGCVWEDAPLLRIDEWIVKGMIQGASQMQAVNATTDGNETILWFKGTDDTPPPDQISSIQLVADSPYHTMLADNKAIDGNTLYLLKSKTGAWGQTEYYVKEVSVSVGGTDGKRTVVLSGIGYNDVLIASANKLIHDGDSVLLASYE